MHTSWMKHFIHEFYKIIIEILHGISLNLISFVAKQEQLYIQAISVRIFASGTKHSVEWLKLLLLGIIFVWVSIINCVFWIEMSSLFNVHFAYSAYNRIQMMAFALLFLVLWKIIITMTLTFHTILYASFCCYKTIH